MLFYLTSTDKVNLLDFVESHIGLIPKKMTGKFSLMQFIIRDMRNYLHVKYFVVDRAAVIEDDNGLIEAVASFQTMFDARVIVICEGISENDIFLRDLVMAGVTNIITAKEIELIQTEILECLSPDGMTKYTTQKQENPMQSENVKKREDFTFSANNVRIAIAGCLRRVGTTTTAINLAYWIRLHGGTACYIESNPNRHLACVLKLYDVRQESNHYTIEGVDYYFNDKLDKDYDFIITDCGELTVLPQSSFKEADIRLICGSAMPYEFQSMREAASHCHLPVQVLGMCVSEDIRTLLKSSVGEDISFLDASHELFDGKVNGKLHRKLLSEYIIE